MGAFVRRRLGVFVLAVLVLLLLSANRIATFLTELWWYDQVGATEVLTGRLAAQALLFVAFGIFLAALVAINLQIARKIRPLFIPSTQQEMQLERYRQQADPYLKWIIGGVAALFGLSAGGTAATQWENFLLWRNGGSFGIADPQFNTDIGFYVFDLPWWSFVQGAVFTALVLTAIVTVAAHVMLGGIRPDNPGDKVTGPVKRHLSILLVLILVTRAVGWWLDRYSLNFSPRGTVTGASFTDVNAELPALYLLMGLTVVAVGLVLWSLRRRGFLLAGAGIALLVVASLVLQGLYPALIQRLRVDPQELARETEYIDRNLEATRAAYGLTETQLQSFDVSNAFDEDELNEEAVTLTNVRLWDTETLSRTYSELQTQRPYYRFNEVDVDRYEIDGELRQVMLSTRELDLDGLTASTRSWQNDTLTYTHGLGVVASQVNTATTRGQPVFLAEDIPPTGVEELTPEQDGIYYGEAGNPPYSIVRTDGVELDYETGSGEEQVATVYDGEGGVELGNRLRRLAFALRFGDPNFVLSGLLNNDSRVLYHRDVQDRVRQIAPYLSLDADPYPVVLDERIVWVQDAYTTSANYPYAERVDGGRHGTLNYIRNSVKAVVDAYDGTVTLYVVLPEDPIVQAWMKAFPGTYADLDEAPAELEAHFRYPQDLFRIQSAIYATYHIPNAASFYNKADEWQIPVDAPAVENNPGTQLRQRLQPYYLLMRLPGEEREEFVLIQPYQPSGKKIMNAWLAGRSDPGHYGELFAVQFPVDEDVLGPEQAQARIEQETEISQFITLLDSAGSRVIRGNMQIIPIGDSILYVEPLFIENAQAGIPELSRVVVVLGDRTIMNDTLAGALAELVGAAPPADDQPGDDGPDSEDPDELLRQAIQAFTDADEALRDGNLARYQALVNRGVSLLQRAAELRGINVEELLAPEPEPSPQPTDAEASPAPDEGATSDEGGDGEPA